MDKKIKVLLVCLGLVSLLAVGLGVWIHFSAQTEVNTYAKKQSQLEKDNTDLQKKLESSQREIRHWREKTESITESLNNIGKEHTLLQRQYDSLLKAEAALAEKNQELIAELERLNKLYAQAEQKKPVVQVDKSDEFLASLLEEKAALQVKLERLQDAKRRPTEEEFANLKEKIEILEKKLESAQEVTDKLSKELLQEKKKRGALEEELSKADNQVRDILRERDGLLEQLTKMRQALEQRLVELGKTKEVLEGAVETATDAVKKPEIESIELTPIIVRANAGVKKFSRGTEQEIDRARLKTSVIEKETPEIIGRIITVNQRHKFVVIDIGRDEGVQKGMEFDVYHRDEKVGKVTAIEIRGNIAACDIKEMTSKGFKANDAVRR